MPTYSTYVTLQPHNAPMLAHIRLTWWGWAGATGGTYRYIHVQTHRSVKSVVNHSGNCQLYMLK